MVSHNLVSDAINAAQIFSLWQLSLEWHDVIKEYFKDMHTPKKDISGALQAGLDSLGSQLYAATKGYTSATAVRMYTRNLPANNQGECRKQCLGPRHATSEILRFECCFCYTSQ